MESLLQKRGVRLTLLVLVCFGALYGAYQLSAIFAPLLFSFIVAYVLDPVADALERRKMTRLAAVITIFSVGTIVTVGFLFVGGYFISSAVTSFWDDLTSEPGYTQEQIDSRAVVSSTQRLKALGSDGKAAPRPAETTPETTFFLDLDDDSAWQEGEPRYTQGELEGLRERKGVIWVDDLAREPDPDASPRWYHDVNHDDRRNIGYLEQARNTLVSLGEDLDQEVPTTYGQVAYSAVVEWLNEKHEQLSQGSDADTKRRIQKYLDSMLPPFLRTNSESGELADGAAVASSPAPSRDDETGTKVVIESQNPDAPANLSLFSRIFTWVSWILLCPLYIFYLLLEIDPIVERIRGYLPGKQRPRVERIVGKIDRTMAAFFRGRLTICVVKGLGTSLGLLVLGVPFAFPLGLAAGFLALVPYVGIWFAIVPTLILAWLDSNSFGYIAAVGGVFALMEVLEGFVLIPKLLGKEVGLHPLTVIVTMLIFAEVLGFVGILLSVPLAAIAKILIEEFVMPLVEEFAAETPDGESPSAGGGAAG